MDANDRIGALLEEIRDLQREHLAEYRRVTERSLELQQQAVERQQQAAATYARIVRAGGVLTLFLLGLLLYLLVRWSPYLFR